MLSDLFTFCKHKSIDYLAGLMPKTYSMVEENNILGIYDSQFLITKQENLVGLLELQGLSYLNLMQQDLEHYFNARKSALDSIPLGVHLRIVAKRRKEQIKQNTQIDNPYARAIIAGFESKEIYDNRYYLVFESTTGTLKSFFEKKKLEMSTSIAESQDNQERSKQKNITFINKHSMLKAAMQRISHALKDFNPRELSSQEALRFYAEYINGFNIPLKPKMGILSDSYIASDVEFRKDYFLINFKGKTTYQRFVGVKNYENQTITSVALSCLLHYACELDIIFSIEPLGIFESLHFLKVRKKFSFVNFVKEELDRYIDLVQASRLSMQKIASNVLIRAESKESLDRHTEAVLNLLNNEGLVSKEETIGMIPSYFSFFPGRMDLNYRARYQTSSVMAALILFEKNNKGFKANSWGDMPLSVFKNLDHSPYLFNFHNQEVQHKGVLAHNIARVNGHTMIIGATGAGKTTLMSYLMMSALKYPNLDILALDRLNGLYSFTKYFGGVYNNDEEFYINPLTLEDSKENVEFLWSFYTYMLGIESTNKRDKELTEDQNAVRNAIGSMYADHKKKSKQQEAYEPYTLEEFTNTFIKTQSEQIKGTLEPYLQNPIFNAREDCLEFKSRITTINMDSVINNQKDAGLLAYYIFYKLIHRALHTNRGFFCFIDEFKSYAQNALMNDKINLIITQARKVNGVVALALQDIHQLDEVKNADSFIKNMGTLIFYPQKNINTDKLKDQFGIKLSDLERHFLENTNVSSHQILIKNMNDSTSNVVDVSLAALGKYLPIFSSNASTMAHIKHLIKQYPTSWREVFVHG
ncbi:VirB4 family type IV secretion/conjugal transfer ATPase [Helicobacter suis]|uniref:VirB4 family type IV secretion/conjugal transfer ATPase n=1 Tax=Helicobacter suis TaxID=104628 RepID=UPI000CF14F29|nr:VirB4 family type IV secretion/conjugal transfer ATPase [Helicobacter suis]